MIIRDKHTLKHQAIKGIHKSFETGYKQMNTVATNAALDAWPDGKLYLSGPNTNMSFGTAGRLRRLIDFKIAIITISNISPMSKFIWISNRLGLLNK